MAIAAEKTNLVATILHQSDFMVGYEMDKPVGTRYRLLAFNYDLPTLVLPPFSIVHKEGTQDEEAEEITSHSSFLTLPFAQADVRSTGHQG